jgi:hypothetical protein
MEALASWTDASMMGLDNGRSGARFQLRIIQQQGHIVKQRALIALQRQSVSVSRYRGENGTAERSTQG